ncbi:MAG: hypothetical protein IJA86_09130 [Clostridia bacterium]|nr:hypothetical protein [Clostridia bacterium]
MYSRSYGSIESEKKTESFAVPADYNGSLYPGRTEAREVRKKTEDLPPKEENDEPMQKPVPAEEPTASSRPSGNGSSLLEKFSAEDIILFILVFSLLKEDNGDSGTILAVILALLLL